MENEFNKMLISSYSDKNKYEYDKDYSARSESDWTKFCLLPDIHEPVRMPSMFPIPTHIIRRRITKTISFQTGVTQLSMLWSPEFFNSAGYLFATTDPTGFNDNTDPADYYQEYNSADWDFGTTNSATESSNNASYFDTTDSINDELAHGGVRLIGAILKLRYVGKIDDISGLIEAGLHLNSHQVVLSNLYSSTIATAKAELQSDVHFADTDEIQQQDKYMSTSGGDGLRLIWVPLDQRKFLLRPGVDIVNGYPTGLDGQVTSSKYLDLGSGYLSGSIPQEFWSGYLYSQPLKPPNPVPIDSDVPTPLHTINNGPYIEQYFDRVSDFNSQTPYTITTYTNSFISAYYVSDISFLWIGKLQNFYDKHPDKFNGGGVGITVHPLLKFGGMTFNFSIDLAGNSMNNY